MSGDHVDFRRFASATLETGFAAIPEVLPTDARVVLYGASILETQVLEEEFQRRDISDTLISATQYATSIEDRFYGFVRSWRQEFDVDTSRATIPRGVIILPQMDNYQVGDRGQTFIDTPVSRITDLCHKHGVPYAFIDQLDPDAVREGLDRLDKETRRLTVIQEANGRKGRALATIGEMVAAPFDGELPDAIFSHSGGMAFRPEEAIAKYMTTSYASDQLTEHGQATGGRLRIIATKAIADAVPDVPIVTNSFMDGHPDAPTMAEVAKQELVGRGVDEARIIKEERSFTTITQHREMIKMAVANGWTKLTVIVNQFHVPRVQAFLDRLDTLTEVGLDDSEFQATLAQFKEMGGRVAIIPAESVIEPLDPRFGEYFGRVALSPQYEYTEKMEAKGLADLEAGNYKARLTPKTPPAGYAA